VDGGLVDATLCYAMLYHSLDVAFYSILSYPIHAPVPVVVEQKSVDRETIADGSSAAKKRPPHLTSTPTSPLPIQKGKRSPGRRGEEANIQALLSKVLVYQNRRRGSPLLHGGPIVQPRTPLPFPLRIYIYCLTHSLPPLPSSVNSVWGFYNFHIVLVIIFLPRFYSKLVATRSNNPHPHQQQSIKKLR